MKDGSPGAQPPPPPSTSHLDSSFQLLPDTPHDHVPFTLVDDSPSHADPHDHDTLEALRTAISGFQDQGPPPTQPDATGAGGLPSTLQAATSGVQLPPTPGPSSAAVVPATPSVTTAPDELGGPTLIPASQVQMASIDKAVAALQQISQSNQKLIEGMNAASILQGLMGSFKMLSDQNRRQAELVKNLIDSIQGRGPPTIDPALSIAYVPRSEYDALKARYEALVSTSAMVGSSAGASSSNPARRARAARQSSGLGGGDDPDKLREVASGSAGGTPFGDEDKRVGGGGGRKRRSMKLEHLVHKMANRRIGVEYQVSGFDSRGSRDLPDPTSVPPAAEQSINGVDEFRPDFRADGSAATVRPFLEVVIQDCKAAWGESYAVEEPEVDEEQIVKAVHTYWTRLSKRYDEQLARDRGEVHKDELTRRKQNQYRRQQSLVARRAAAFDTSPLNQCRLRALYRTLLTIDFAAMTNERPDPKRQYTEDEWNAYRKQACGPRAQEAHEVVDQFWLSPTVRMLLTILDTWANDQTSKMRRKGRPKAPAPTFHLPEDLWDRSTLPLIRPKDAQGLPIQGAGGIILFKFHIDEKVQSEYPDWAQGLYDNPPVPDEDRLHSDLRDVMNTSSFFHLKPRIKISREQATIARLTPEEIHETLERDDVSPVHQPVHHHHHHGGHAPPLLDETGAAVAAAAVAAEEAGGFDLSSVSGAEFLGRGLESIVALASPHILGSFSTAAATTPATATAPAVGTGAGAPPAAITAAAHAHLVNLGLETVGAVGAGAGPSPGSSVRARKQAKRMMSEVPGGAATPVPKRPRRADPATDPAAVPPDPAVPEADVDLSGDASFLDTF